MDDYDFGEVENVGVAKKKVRFLSLLLIMLWTSFSLAFVLLPVVCVLLSVLAY